MRLTVWLVGVLAAAGVAGCTSAPSTEPVDIVVFLDADPTEAQLQEIEAELRAVPGASGLTFESGEEAYERFRELFTDSPELVETVTVDSLPDSYRFTLADHTTADPIIADLGQLPGGYGGGEDASGGAAAADPLTATTAEPGFDRSGMDARGRWLPTGSGAGLRR